MDARTREIIRIVAFFVVDFLLTCVMDGTEIVRVIKEMIEEDIDEYLENNDVFEKWFKQFGYENVREFLLEAMREMKRMFEE